jgi:hypothetical protein
VSRFWYPRAVPNELDPANVLKRALQPPEKRPNEEESVEKRAG